MSRMVSLVRTDADKMSDMMSLPSRPDVPPGMCIALTDRELELLGVDDDVEVGDMLHMKVMIQVTAVHKEEGSCRIEASIIGGTAEDEMDEDPGEDESD